MNGETIHGVALDVCSGCGGIWFDSDELRALLASEPDALQELEPKNAPPVEQSHQGPSTLLCPNCAVTLDEYHYMYNSPVILHACRQCGGFWVAAGDIAQMEAWREKMHQPLSPQEQVAVDFAEATAIHQREMLHLQNMADFFGVLRRYQPGWIGFVP